MRLTSLTTLLALLHAGSAAAQSVPLTDGDAPPSELPTTDDACLFGEAFSDLRSSPALAIRSEVWIRSSAGLADRTALQLLHSVQQSSHTDATTAVEALARVDQQQVRRIDFTERATGVPYVVFEYGVGHSSYGAYFALQSTEVIASIQDGDIADCQVTASQRVEEQQDG